MIVRSQAILLLSVFLVAVMGANIASTAFVVCKGWEWFVVPLGAGKLGFGPAMGLTVLARFVAHPVRPENVQEAKRLSVPEWIGYAVLPWYAFVILWLVKVLT